MALNGLLGILKLVALWLVVVAIVLAVVFVGGVLVVAVTLPATLALPTVRRQFVALTEHVTDVRPDSVTDWRFVGVYAVCVFAYGLTLLVGSAALAESLPPLGRLVPAGPFGALSMLAVVALFALVAVGLLLAVRWAVPGVRLRAVGEWTTFLALVGVLTGAAAVVVPTVLFRVVGFFL